MTLKKGSSGPDVSKLVKDLTKLGYYSGPPTSLFDNEVLKAVRAFQMQGVDGAGRPLVVDGIVGPVTIAAIAAELAGATGSAAPPAISPAVPAGGSARARAALNVALAELNRGAGESGGNNVGPDVDKYLNHIVPAPADWCAGFVSYCFKNSGLPMPYSYSLGARDTLKQLKAKGWGVTCSDANPPQPGDVIVWWRVAPSSWKGHIGLVLGYSGGIVTTIEGNKTPKVGKFNYTLGAIDKLLGFARVP